MSNETIRVKYIGKFDSMVCDYNHKRFCFRSKERISVIPTVVYDYIKQQKDILSTELIPYQEEEVKQEEKPAGFKPLSMKEYSKLNKEGKTAYRQAKEEAEKANVEQSN